MVITLGQQYNVGEKPTVILYTYINRHSGTPTKRKTKQLFKSAEVYNMILLTEYNIERIQRSHSCLLLVQYSTVLVRASTALIMFNEKSERI